MRAAAILGLGCSPKALKPFQAVPGLPGEKIEWRMGMPASSDEVDVILLFGGDGTIHRHLGQLVKLGLPVLVVPAGSGNDFARALGFGGVRHALAAWQKFAGGAGNVRAIDLGVIAHLNQGAAPGAKLGTQDAGLGTRYFCCVAGVGLDAEVARRANRLPRWLRGNGGYVLSLAPTILTFAPLPMKILASDQLMAEKTAEHCSAGQPQSTPLVPRVAQGRLGGAVPANAHWTLRSDQPTLLAAFANTPVYGGGMKIAPQAKMDDGQLDICIVGGVGTLKLFSLFPTVYFGRHLGIREVEYFQAPGVRVETERPLDVYADGEYVCQTPVEVGIQPSALNVVTP